MSRHTVQITKVTCHGTSESGHDEVYLVHQADAGIPIRYPDLYHTESMNDGDHWHFHDNLILSFDHELLLTVWDQDVAFVPSVATFLQCVDFPPPNRSVIGKEGEVKLKNPNGADYHVHFVYRK